MALKPMAHLKEIDTSFGIDNTRTRVLLRGFGPTPRMHMNIVSPTWSCDSLTAVAWLGSGIPFLRQGITAERQYGCDAHRLDALDTQATPFFASPSLSSESDTSLLENRDLRTFKLSTITGACTKSEGLVPVSPTDSTVIVPHFDEDKSHAATASTGNGLTKRSSTPKSDSSCVVGDDQGMFMENTPLRTARTIPSQFEGVSPLSSCSIESSFATSKTTTRPHTISIHQEETVYPSDVNIQMALVEESQCGDDEQQAASTITTTAKHSTKEGKRRKARRIKSMRKKLLKRARNNTSRSTPLSNHYPDVSIDDMTRQLETLTLNS